MFFTEERKRQIEELSRIGEERGFTFEYQEEQTSKLNEISRKKRAPVTDERYDRAVNNWKIWMLSRNEPETRYFAKQEPDPPNQILKLFCESFIVLRKRDLPSQSTVCHNLSCFIAEWERETQTELPDHVTDDVYNHIKEVLTPKYGLQTKHREKFPVTRKDLDILLRHLFEKDDLLRPGLCRQV